MAGRLIKGLNILPRTMPDLTMTEEKLLATVRLHTSSSQAYLVEARSVPLPPVLAH